MGGLSPNSPKSNTDSLLATTNEQQQSSQQQQQSNEINNQKTLLDKIVQNYTKDQANRTSRIM